MANRKRGLGRGLDSLLSSTTAANISSNVPRDGDRLQELPIEQIQRSAFQPRTRFDQEQLDSLAASIKAKGIIQPIVVRPSGKNSFEIIAGERRWRAAQLAQLHKIPAVIRDVSDGDAMAMALIENIQRQQLNPIDEANALQRLLNEFEMTHQQVAEQVGRSRTAVTNLLRLLALLPADTELVEAGKLEMGHARALLGADQNKQLNLANKVVKERLSVRQTETLVKKSLTGETKKSAKKAATDPNINQLEQDLGERLGAKVKLQHTSKGTGKLVVSYNSLEELDGILQKIH
ncbi:MAG: ParB/RepB/Spo0J family partition protein [Immundisolibacteraceae bacterium]|nr:ParB/RepB/Spo0J family partition protein [Immundisolibacteraceae bacterium]